MILLSLSVLIMRSLILVLIGFQAVKHVELLPRVAVSVSLRGRWADTPAEKGTEERPILIHKNGPSSSQRDDKWMQVATEEEYTLMVNLRRLNKAKVF